jgi:hypothetical protein
MNIYEKYAISWSQISPRTSGWTFTRRFDSNDGFIPSCISICDMEVDDRPAEGLKILPGALIQQSPKARLNEKSLEVWPV